VNVTEDDTQKRVVVWDAPIRVFHWTLVAAFAACWLTFSDNRFLHIHVFAGYLVLGLVVFRVAWGFAGTRYARFADFLRGWDAFRDYLAGLKARDPERFMGHNPVAGWAVMFLMGMCLLITLSGVVVLGVEEGHGPLAAWMRPAAAEPWREAHEVLAWVALAFVPLHLAGVFVEGRVLGESLLGAMIHGHKWQAPGAVGVPAQRRVAAVLVGLAAMGGAAFFSGAVTAGPEGYRPFKGPQLARSALYDEECGACHLAFHPTLLPARSWEAVMAGQEDHFGEDLMLAPDTVAGLLPFMTAAAAETGWTEPAYKINRSVPPDAVPLRITETGYWKRKHADIPQRVWDQANVHGPADCAACHLDAEEGTFEDAAMRLPDPPPPDPNDGGTP
jgi:cytochrome b